MVTYAKVTMTMRDLDRLKVIHAVIDGDLNPMRAVERLGLTSRQVRRLARRYEREGPIGLTSRRFNRPSNNELDSGLRRRVVGILRELYADFGPTLAAATLGSPPTRESCEVGAFQRGSAKMPVSRLSDY
jgi:hypothetical protein